MTRTPPPLTPPPPPRAGVCVCLSVGVHHFDQVSRLSVCGHTGILGSGRSPSVRPTVQARGASLCCPSTSAMCTLGQSLAAGRPDATQPPAICQNLAGGGGGGWHVAWGGVGRRGGGGWHKASVSDCLPLAAPIGLSPLLILTLRGPERVLVVSTEAPDDLSCLTTPGSAVGGGGGGGYRRYGGGVAMVCHWAVQDQTHAKKNSAPLVPWPLHYYLSKLGGGGGVAYKDRAQPPPVIVAPTGSFISSPDILPSLCVGPPPQWAHHLSWRLPRAPARPSLEHAQSLCVPTTKRPKWRQGTRLLAAGRGNGPAATQGSTGSASGMPCLQPRPSLFCDTGGGGGLKSWRRQELFQGRHCFCPTPTRGGGGGPVKEAGAHSPPCPPLTTSSSGVE